MKRIILCRPAGPRNIGSILRAALNFGPAEIVIVAPARPSLLIHPDFEQMSHGGEGSRETIQVVDTIEEALVDCHHVVAFTARARHKQLRVNWRDHAPKLQEIADSPDERLALVFGSEESGLTREEAAAATEIAHLRTAPAHTSLNLAQAVTVVLHSLFTGNEVHQHEPKPKRLDSGSREFLKQKMHAVFTKGVARTESAAEDIGSMIDRMFTRAPMEPRDARAWHLILRAMGSEAEPSEFGTPAQEKGARRKQALERRRRLDGEPPATD
ncbi:tRNA (cytidine/uridine-2'-O-)-methyltransferase TrmJ [Planctomycetes bacterium Poly30]|uniref:tRNA (Cytidine/uridine-2'-O-)-methyltransferase TrmJ n=1 Tax=Saltatorellus ferox TaxID=2528018 RepID=A0A518EXT5_9BACT|nr:tRNA (cytidine/uridine-2'-O-)-methyltransferase TrmJ [Planctomycetes bacterium Poly30]